MNKIQIYVSHRIDLESALIDNPLYVPVYCGAIYAAPGTRRLQRDDTGDNISEKRMSFCEFTVQYWAWKNCDADYMGLCHYRRYLSFADHHFQKVNVRNMIEVPFMSPWIEKKYGLCSPSTMTEEIQKYDAIFAEPGAVSCIPTYTGEQAHNIRQLWQAHAGLFFDTHSLDLLLTLIDQIEPEYSDTARQYFSSTQHIGYNCYVMKKDLFHALCEFQFPVLFELERILPAATMKQYPRTIGYMGEILYGIFSYRLITEGRKKVAYKQMVFFEDTTPSGFFCSACRYALKAGKSCAKNLVDRILPIGSKRRKFIKRILKKG